MPSLESWKGEIERVTRGVVQVIPVVTDKTQNVLTIPPAFPGRAIVRQLFLRESFVTQFIRAYALTVNYAGIEGVFHFVLLNQAMADTWQDKRELLIAHEYGHLWLNATGYPSPIYESCLSTHSGDVVQHILIRDEMQRRGFDLSFWIRNLEEWQRRMEPLQGPQTLEPCERLQLLSQWMDAELGVPDWEPRGKLLSQARLLYPGIAPVAAALAASLRERDLWDRTVYANLLAQVTTAMHGLVVP